MWGVYAENSTFTQFTIGCIFLTGRKRSLWYKFFLVLVSPKAQGRYYRAVPPCGHQPASSCLGEDAACSHAHRQTLQHSSTHCWVLSGHGHGLHPCVVLVCSSPFQEAFSHWYCQYSSMYNFSQFSLLLPELTTQICWPGILAVLHMLPNLHKCSSLRSELSLAVQAPFQSKELIQQGWTLLKWTIST